MNKVGKGRLQTLNENEVTNKTAYLNRRQIIKAAGLSTFLGGFTESAAQPLKVAETAGARGPPWLRKLVSNASVGRFSTTEKLTPFEYVTGYNNFYEFGPSKSDPSEKSSGFVSDPWGIEVKGACEVTGQFHLEDILRGQEIEERIYRLRCVEAWSMVIPWIGFPLNRLLSRFKPTSQARYVKFETVYRPSQMPGQGSFFATLDYPYVEGLRIDEAMNELAFIAVGLYGEPLLPQNGAPLRLVVPWKYGFKSLKSIAKITFQKHRPQTSWQLANSKEYGFFSNVNPDVSHPRWSQATERRLPSGLFGSNRMDTLPFNGYGDEVSHLYKGMNLRIHY
ncbi:MAG: protein-methionine-sulfoxide reductase catalytic subunit MsrP [Pseudomonadales bacterium]|jgi:sulfoxide reductase catalytic subunit YedY|nr:protein-methionine-sulfoxide reductase catalytic subunit MsrP [Pseudomonadales bacterium]